jgi:hypothetical protein
VTESPTNDAEKDREPTGATESSTHNEDQGSIFKINKYQKRKSEKGFKGIIASSSSKPAEETDADSDRAPSELQSNGSHRDGRKFSDGARGGGDGGWVCKTCHFSGNHGNECEMCQQRKKDSCDEGDVKNRKKRKNLNRSRLKAGFSIRVNEARDRQKRIAQKISSNIEEYCRKVYECV